mmetsp:Transcript_1765/g.2407  ORF Transcript_1765/g.2407 Transcript_1765/m.2407 type:complete len:118 (-) Transcript_1765:464-817(-)
MASQFFAVKRCSFHARIVTRTCQRLSFLMQSLADLICTLYLSQLLQTSHAKSSSSLVVLLQPLLPPSHAPSVIESQLMRRRPERSCYCLYQANLEFVFDHSVKRPQVKLAAASLLYL